MKTIRLTKGLDIPITGTPNQQIGETVTVATVGLQGDDYIGMRPTMEVAEGDFVKTGQLVFSDKKNEGVRFVSPATGTITAIRRGERRKFESIVIAVEKDDFIPFLTPKTTDAAYTRDEIRTALVSSSLWTAFRTRPYGKIPPIDATPTAIFVTAMDTRPLAPSAPLIIDAHRDEFLLGLRLLDSLTDSPTFVCVGDDLPALPDFGRGVETVQFIGPHPAGLPSTHIHFLKPAGERNIAWHIDYQDVIGIGHLFTTGNIPTEKVIAVAGPSVLNPTLLRVRIGADISEIVLGRIGASPSRVISGSILDGRKTDDVYRFLGRYHNQISVLPEENGRGLFSWATPGSNRFSVKHLFLSALCSSKRFPMNTALWGGRRAIYPLDSYDRVMPLDIISLPLLKSLYGQDSDKAKQLGALELIEEDVALLSFVCPGKNDFAPVLRRMLTEIEVEG